MENDTRLHCSAEGTTHVVKILGREYPLRCTGERDELVRIAEYVDSVMRQVMDSSSVSAHSDVAVLAALNIASELFSSAPSEGVTPADIEKRTQTILLRLEESLPNLESA